MSATINYDIDYYEVLGVTRTATAKEIKTNYKKLVQKHHPDKSQHEKSKDVFVLINEAYTVLSDNNLKNQYDSKYKHKKIKYFELPITFEESLDGVKINTHIGLIDIPSGTRDGAKMVYNGHTIEIKVENHSSLKRINDDLYTTHAISSLLAITGGSITYKTYNNQQIIVHIPTLTKADTVLKLVGRGARNTDTGVIGDLFIQLKLETPMLTGEQIADIIAITSSMRGINDV